MGYVNDELFDSGETRRIFCLGIPSNVAVPEKPDRGRASVFEVPPNDALAIPLEWKGGGVTNTFVSPPGKPHFGDMSIATINKGEVRA
jgi:hypothetical protein